MRHFDETDPEPSDGWLAEQAALGSTDALAVLYERYGRVVVSFATRMLGDRDSGEELLQEVFVRVWRQAGTYSADRGSFVTWILSITHNLAIDTIRKRQRRPQRADSADPFLMLANVADSGPPVERQVEMSQLGQVVRSAIATLPDTQRQAIEMAYFRGLTQREIAAELGDPLGTVKTRMRLGMQKLREYLEQHEVELP
ncbi:MAG TPA: sigma-70 family RNA polymerase sigma factor [Thermomicrobiales bacterium]|nr:sigma-70 family RNA polymerase sigma factor [Thermomicrobiales bacterium]